MSHLTLWFMVPIVLIILIALVQSMRLAHKHQLTTTKLTRAMAPLTLRLLFLCYPIITNKSFEAFSCYSFDDGSRWLIADVRTPI